MLIACPSCDTSFSVADHLVGPSGRVLHCAKCTYQWRHHPQRTSIPAGETAKSAFEIRELDITNSINDAIEKGRSPIEAFTASASMRKIKIEVEIKPLPDPPFTESPKMRFATKRLIHLTLLTLLSTGSIAFLYIFRQPFMEFASYLKGKSEDWTIPREAVDHQLEIANIKFIRQTKDGKDTIVIEGTIFNLSNQAMEIPPMAATAIDKEGKEVPPDRSFALPAQQIQPGEIITFQAMIANLPKEVQNLRIGFAN